MTEHPKYLCVYYFFWTNAASVLVYAEYNE